jgi:hypothetical protein
MKKVIMYFLALWVLVNVGLFIGSGNFLLKNDNNVFFPFGETVHYVYTVKSAIDIKDYDYSEFIVYAIIIPALVLILLFRKETINFFNNRIDQFNKKNTTNVSDNISGAENRQMHKQRILIIIANLLTLICVFLPWASASFGSSSIGSISVSMSGLHEKWDGFGIAIIIIAFLIIILSLLGERKAILKKAPRIIVIILNVLILIDVFLIVAATKSQGGTFVENSTGWFWLIPILSVASIVLAIFYKSVNRLEIKTNS